MCSFSNRRFKLFQSNVLVRDDAILLLSILQFKVSHIWPLYGFNFSKWVSLPGKVMR